MFPSLQRENASRLGYGEYEIVEGLRGEKDKQTVRVDEEKPAERHRRASRKGNRSAQVRHALGCSCPPSRFACFTTSLSSALLNFALVGKRSCIRITSSRSGNDRSFFFLFFYSICRFSGRLRLEETTEPEIEIRTSLCQQIINDKRGRETHDRYKYAMHAGQKRFVAFLYGLVKEKQVGR